MPKRTLALIIGLIVLTVVLLFAATRTGLKPQTPQQPNTTPAISPSPTPPAYTTLELSPNPLTLTPAGTGSIAVIINTQQNKVRGIQLELSYDPKALTNVAITQGSFLPNPLSLWNKVDPQTGRITEALVLPPSQTGVTGTGTVATITFSKVAGSGLTQTQLQFMPKTGVSQPGISQSVLKSSTGATINLGSQTTQLPPVTQTSPAQQ